MVTYPDGITHELGGNLQHIRGHGGGQQYDLSIRGEELEDVVDLLLEPTGKHLVGLVEHEHLYVISFKGATVDHVVDAAGSAHYDVGAGLELLNVLTDVSAADASVAVHVHEIAEGDDDLLDLLRQFAGGSEDEGLALVDVHIELLEDGNGEGGGLAGTGLGLGNDIMTLHDRENGALLNSRRPLKTT
ncbi:hypothetical protein BC936DRAFT_137585 [Jimgerdemannia flammicorona]|uniref:Uncharacterized protein n=1 Tax=Jimgerdemannia flammicorona TaxID=994334 RepID=A0A433CX07_9FUNG|nr:hypothetical protein BC936DRAFT_137585 [Jimgerdemannia flammicorona]